MAITPQTNIRLLKVPLEISNKNQLTFTSKQEQYNYFNSLPKIEEENCYYQRKDNILNFPAHIDSILEYNYCMYQNENYSDKWFYAYITNMQYENDGLTRITLVTDVFQTWQFDLNWKQSFIEREHISVTDDVPGANLVPEGLETGEFQIDGTADFTDKLSPLFVIAYLDDEITLQNTTYHFTGGKYNGILNGILFIVGTDDLINDILFDIKSQGNSDKIMTVFTIPKFACSYAIDNPTTGNDYAVLSGDTFQSVIEETFTSTPSTLDGYAPRNQKLRTYPYLYLGFNPQTGNQKIYRYEDFLNGTPIFKMICELNQNPTTYFIPQNYRGQSGDSVADCCSLNGYPTISWKTDYFNTWLAQNSSLVLLQAQQEQYNYSVDVAKSGMNLLGGMVNNTLSANIVGGLADAGSGALNLASLDVNHDFYIKNTVAQIEKQKMLPDNGSMGSSNATLMGYNMFKNIFNRYTIKRQFAERIDKFFDMYGYSTNIVKLPNLNNRPNWNYIKTIGANITANIPQQDLQLIKAMFDNGITLWHNTETFLDYSQNNRD